MEVPLDRPGILRIHQVADIRVVQGQCAGFPFIPFQTVDLCDSPSRTSPAAGAPERLIAKTQFVIIFEHRFFAA
jgi:hypothetical protein